MGLVELFRYDSEEFWFRDGHLLLRDNNGTGKSKVLALTMPFLFDARLTAARLAPDGDPGKKMAWNLLLGSYERRTGYAWIEFGRIRADGSPQFLTLGAGLSAIVTRPQVESWYFVCDGPPVGEDFWLTTPQRTVVPKERLRDAIGGAGQLFDNARDYRRAVDERLFHLGTMRYEALMDTLVQLRQPQLSKRPDETNLSNALTEALPPLASDMLCDVAEALSRLEDDRRQLEEYQELEHAVSRFERRYRLYAGAQSRRQARKLRQAQTEFDNASREFNEAQERLMAARLAEQHATAGRYDATLELANQQTRLETLRSDPAMQDANRLEQAQRDATARRAAHEAAARWEVLRDTVGASVTELEARLAQAAAAVASAQGAAEKAQSDVRTTGEARAVAGVVTENAHQALEQSAEIRSAAVRGLQAFAATGLLAVALAESGTSDVPDLRIAWTIDPALSLARRTEQILAGVDDSDVAWRRIQQRISEDFTELQRALSALGQQVQGETNDYGLVVHIVYQNRPESPVQLAKKLAAEIAQRRELLSASEREVLENHVQAEIATEVQRLLIAAEKQVEAINAELYKRPTSTGVRYRLQWAPLAEGADGAPVGLEAARKRLLNTSSDLWSAEDRRVVGSLLQQRIAAERENADVAGSSNLTDQLARALDYRRWHQFRVQRFQDGQCRKLSGPASSGERALGLTVPLFAAVASFYSQSGYSDAAARAHCMALIREFDLDFRHHERKRVGLLRRTAGRRSVICSAARASTRCSFRAGPATAARAGSKSIPTAASRRRERRPSVAAARNEGAGDPAKTLAAPLRALRDR